MASPEASAKKRVELTTVEKKEEIATPSKKAKLDDVKPESAGKNDFLSFTIYANTEDAQETEINDLVKAYIGDFISSLKKLNKTNDKKVELLLRVFNEFKEKYPTFLKFKTFAALLMQHSQNVKAAKDEETIIDYHHNLILELKRYLTPAENPSTSSVNKEKKIRELTVKIDEVRNKITDYETRELTLEEMENDTFYTKISKLKNCLVKLWRRRESLNNHSVTLIGQHAFKKFSYNKTKNAQVNSLVEKYYGSCMQKLREREDMAISRSCSDKLPVTFDDLNVIELRDFLDREIKKAKIDYKVSEEELIKIFDDLIRERNHRRWSDLNDDFITLTETAELKPDSLPNENDEDFKKSITKNSEVAFSALKKVMNNFVEIDKQLNKQFADPEFLGQDDVGENEMDAIDEEEEENEEDDDDDDGGGDGGEKADKTEIEEELVVTLDTEPSNNDTADKKD